MLSDCKFALRQLVKSPGFAIVAVLSLALGIGVNATMFGFVREMVLQPLLRNRSQRLAEMYTASKTASRDFRFFSYPEFEALRAAPAVFSRLAAVGFSSCIVGQTGSYKRSLIGLVSDSYFPLLQVRPLRGRFFSDAEARPNAAVPVAVATYNLWQRLGQPEDFVGSRIQINSQPYVVIGITPPAGANLAEIGPDVWLPLGMAQQIWGDPHEAGNVLGPRGYFFNVIGSFLPGVNFKNAPERIAGLERQLNAAPVGDPAHPRSLVLTPPPRYALHNSAPVDESYLVPFALIATGLAATVLLVASLNLANMLLARGAARQKEIAIRLSLGATRWRIVRQLFTESLLLAGAAGLAGIALSRASGLYLARMAAADFAGGRFDHPVNHGMNFADIAVVAVLCLGSALLFGLGPALRITQVNLVEDLKRQPGQPAEGGRWNRFFSPRHCRMMIQIAFSFALLFSAGLFVRGSQQATHLEPGFEKSAELVVNLDYIDPHLTSDQIARREQALQARAAGLPGVVATALASEVPFNFDDDTRRIYPAGSAAAALNPADPTVPPAPVSVLTAVSRDYFKTLGIPLLKGRDFTEAESTRPGGHLVAVIDDTLAAVLFGSGEPLGRHIALSAGDAEGKRANRQMEIVGIVRSPQEEVFEASAPHRVYAPLGQRGTANIFLHVRLAEDSAAPVVLDQLRRSFSTLEPETPVLLAQPLADFIDKNINLLLVRLAGMVFGAAGGVALVLAVIGVYGVKAHAVARRTREIGIRIALGARPQDVLALILKQGILQTAVGLSAGLLCALAAGRLATKMLYRVSPLDLPSLAAAAGLLTATVLTACFLPARRATRVDPAVTLRSD